MPQEKFIQVVTEEPTPKQLEDAYVLQDAMRGCDFYGHMHDVIHAATPIVHIRLRRELRLAYGRIRVPLLDKKIVPPDRNES